MRWLRSDNLKSKSGPADVNPKLVGLATLVLAFAGLAGGVEAQQPTKLPRIGYLGPPTSDSRTMAFRQGLRDLGYIEDKNLLVDYRYVAGNPNGYSEVAAELARRRSISLSPSPFRRSSRPSKRPRPFPSSW